MKASAVGRWRDQSLSFREASRASPVQARAYSKPRALCRRLISLLEIAQHHIDFSNTNAMTLDTAKLLPAYGIRLNELAIGKDV